VLNSALNKSYPILYVSC